MKTTKSLIPGFILFFSAINLSAKEYNILDFGAVSDTSILSTAAIQNAINECTVKGGGKVIIPAGHYKTGTIILKSNVEFYLEAGAVLYGSKNLNDYVNLKPAFISLRTQDSTKQLIYAENAQNIVISGFGEIDGRGRNFKKLTLNDEGITRPHLIRFIKCQHIIIENISLRNSACWMQHYLACEKLQIRGVRIFNRNNYNNDAIDIDGCRNVTISDVITDSDDDGITLKSTSPQICENITITNCVVSSHCNAIKMGTESNGGFRNITISNCVVKPSEIVDTVYYGSKTGTSGISLEVVDGGVMRGITISNISIEGTRSPIFIRLGNRARPYKKDLEIKNIGTINDISIDNVRAKNTENIGCSITGMPGFPVSNVRLSNIAIQFEGGGPADSIHKEIPEKAKDYPEATMFSMLPAYGFYIRHASNITFNGVELSVQKEDSRPAFYLDDVQFANFNNMQLQSNKTNEADIWLNKTQNVLIQGSSVKGSSNCFVKATGNETQRISIIHNLLDNVTKVFSADKGIMDAIKEYGNR